MPLCTGVKRLKAFFCRKVEKEVERGYLRSTGPKQRVFTAAIILYLFSMLKVDRAKRHIVFSLLDGLYRDSRPDKAFLVLAQLFCFPLATSALRLGERVRRYLQNRGRAKACF